MSRRNPQANANARELIALLEEKFQERPNYGWKIEYLSGRLGWSDSKTRDTIDWCRNRMIDPRFAIYTFKKGRRWFYKIPDLDEAREYEQTRGLDVARRAGHVLFVVRKRAAKFGVTRETSKRTKAYIEMLHWLREAGVDRAEDILEEALRPLVEDEAA